MDTFNPNQMPPLQAEPPKKSLGPLIAVIIILAIIIIGGLYFLKERAAQPVYVPPPVVEQPVATTTQDNVTQSLNQQSKSDDLNSIEADLNATDIDSLDQGAAAVESQF